MTSKIDEKKKALAVYNGVGHTSLTDAERAAYKTLTGLDPAKVSLNDMRHEFFKAQVTSETSTGQDMHFDVIKTLIGGKAYSGMSFADAELIFWKDLADGTITLGGGVSQLWMPAYTFDSNRHALMPSDFSTFGNNWDIAFYVRFDDLTGTQNIMGAAGTELKGFVIMVDSSNITLRRNTSTDLVFSHSFVTDTWYKVQFRNSIGSKIQFWVDDVLIDGTQTASTDIDDLNELGGKLSSDDGIKGNLIDIHLIDRAVAGNTRVYLSTIDQEEEPTTTTLTDTGGGGDNATLTNFPATKWELVTPPAGYPMTPIDTPE